MNTRRSIFGAGICILLGNSAWAQVSQRVSVHSLGGQGNDISVYPSISADGRYVAFRSRATNLVAGDTNSSDDVFVRDRLAGTTERVSVATGGAQANGSGERPSISADGRFVAFQSWAQNLVAGDTNGWFDIFVRDRLAGTTERVSVDSDGAQGDGNSYFPSISADGCCVAFESNASNLVPGDTNGTWDAFARDRQDGVTERVSVSSGGAQGITGSHYPSISADGRFVAFESTASNLVPGDTYGAGDIFVRDRLAGTTERVSVASDGAEANGYSENSSISADGRRVAFRSEARNLVPGDTNATQDIFVRDRQDARTERVSLGPGGTQGNGFSWYPSISADGRYVAFQSLAANFGSGDTNGAWDVFVHDRFGGPTFTSLCSPGLEGVILCPCTNPPGAPGAGCDNSSGTGGAVLSASGGTYLSSDSLAFTTNGERATAMSILMQGNGVVSGGVLYGQGVRCVGGTIIRRLFTKAAVSGSITAPDFDAGDPTVSTRSAQKGDVIQPGQSRWYLVYYRDPVVLDGCPATTTFNATQTGQVTWSP